jgi:hypothetical protein
MGKKKSLSEKNKKDVVKNPNNQSDRVKNDVEKYVYYDEEDVDIYGTCFDLFKDWD